MLPIKIKYQNISKQRIKLANKCIIYNIYWDRQLKMFCMFKNNQLAQEPYIYNTNRFRYAIINADREIALLKKIILPNRFEFSEIQEAIKHFAKTIYPPNK